MPSDTSVPRVEDLLKLSGKWALVTGASGNIGSGIARRLSEAGASIVAHCFDNREGADRLAEDINDAAGTCVVVQADLGMPDKVDELFSKLEQDHCLPEIVVNNAARQSVQAFEGMTFSDWDEMFAANLDSAFLVTQQAAGVMRNAKTGGSIVNIASIEGTDPAVAHGHYAATKAGLLMLTRACALEFGAHNIRVNSVSPGLIWREGLENDWPEGVERWHSRAPLSRMGMAEDVADATLFLVSAAARWVSGANLVVDGGMSAQSRW